MTNNIDKLVEGIIDSYDKEEDAFADFYQYVTHQINREKL